MLKKTTSSPEHILLNECSDCLCTNQASMNMDHVELTAPCSL